MPSHRRYFHSLQPLAGYAESTYDVKRNAGGQEHNNSEKQNGIRASG
jgi:hypothetical protein